MLSKDLTNSAFASGLCFILREKCLFTYELYFFKNCSKTFPKVKLKSQGNYAETACKIAIPKKVYFNKLSWFLSTGLITFRCINFCQSNFPFFCLFAIRNKSQSVSVINTSDHAFLQFGGLDMNTKWWPLWSTFFNVGLNFAKSPLIWVISKVNLVFSANSLR